MGLLNIDEAELGRLGEKGAGENREGMGDRLRELGWLVISMEMLYSSRFFSSAMVGVEVTIGGRAEEALWVPR